MKPRAECHPRRQHRSLGLCSPCYQAEWRPGRLTEHQHKRRVMTAQEFAQRYLPLRQRGLLHKQIARRLELSSSGMTVAVRRARQAGLIGAGR